MIISRTPYRVSFFGGGTDYPAWYREEGGAVLSTTIDKYSYLTCRYLPPFFGVTHRIVWSHIEIVSTMAEILHPAVREGLKFLGFTDAHGVEVHHQGDLPARSGIGSSSAFSVGLINGLLALRDESIGKHELALKAIDLEQNVLKESVGSQDQVASAYGGLNIIRFETDGTIAVEPLDVLDAHLKDLEARLVLVYTGSSRLGSEVGAKLTANFKQRHNPLRRMRRMVDEGAEALHAGDLDSFGTLLHEGWLLKRSLAEGVTTSRVDAIYETAMANGAMGGKLIGAGGAGFMLFYVPPERREDLRKALTNFVWVPIAFDNTGSTIIYNDKVEPTHRAKALGVGAARG
jgi:D-glycero-alpha-D-manno-heptose-7-phosphate kinase